MGYHSLGLWPLLVNETCFGSVTAWRENALSQGKNKSNLHFGYFGFLHWNIFNNFFFSKQKRVWKKGWFGSITSDIITGQDTRRSMQNPRETSERTGSPDLNLKDIKEHCFLWHKCFKLATSLHLYRFSRPFMDWFWHEMPTVQHKPLKQQLIECVLTSLLLISTQVLLTKSMRDAVRGWQIE